MLSIFWNLSYKLFSRTIECVFSGYCVQHKSYPCLDRKTDRVIFHKMDNSRASSHMTGNEAHLQNKFSYRGPNTVQLSNVEHLVNSYIGNTLLSFGSSAFQDNNIYVVPIMCKKLLLMA